MRRSYPNCLTIHRTLNTAAATALLLAGASAASAANEWTQWGGPSRDFTCDGKGLAASWPDAGPKQLWSRELGEGFATVLVDGDRLYTMYRVGDDEILVALNAADGKTIWEHKYSAPIIKEKMAMEFGLGPHATPLIVGDRIFCVGVVGNLHCVNKADGKPLWSHDFVKEYDGVVMNRGYSCSPIAYKDTIILTCGKQEKAADNNKAIIAFNQKDGSIAWAKHNFEVSHASPILINFAGKDQLVLPSTKEILGIDPAGGEILWSHPHTTQFGANISTPIFTHGDTVIVSSGYQPGGTRAIKLTQKDGKTAPEELWYTAKMRVHIGNIVCVGDRVIGSSGDFGPAFMVALNVADGKLAFRDKGLKKASCVAAGGRLVLLDEDGTLALATPAADKLEIHGKVPLLSNVSWTAPTLVGTKLYIRDRKKIIALDLG